MFLGLELSHSKQGLFLSQRKYSLQILEETSYLDAKPALLPMDPNIKLSKDNGTFFDDEGATCYRRLIARFPY